MYLMYLRKSRSDDASLTVPEVLAKHEAILQDYCIEHFGAPLPESQIYREIVSGETLSDRVEIHKILDRITTEDIDGLIVIEPQRLTRGDLSDCGHIIRCFQFTNTKIITPKRTYDLADDYDRKFFEMELRQGNDYLNYLIGIMQRGRVQSARSGQFIGQSAPFGYDKITIDKKKTLTPNDKASVVQLIFDLYLQGVSPHLIGKELDRRGIKPTNSREWSNKSIHKILTNIHYVGKIKYYERRTIRTVDSNGNIQKKRQESEPLIFDGLHPAIIDDETFKRAQNLIGKTSRKPINKEIVNPFSSLLKCGMCGSAVSYQSYAGKKQPRYACRRQSICGCRSISYRELINKFSEQLKTYANDFEVKATPDNNGNQNALINALQADLTALEKQQIKLYDLLEKGIYSESLFIQRNTELQTQREKLETSLQEAQINLKQQEHIKKYSITFYQAAEDLKDDSIPAEIKNQFLKGFINRINYTRVGDDVTLDVDFL